MATQSNQMGHADLVGSQETSLHKHAEGDITNLTTDLASKVVVAGQIGGSASSPDVRGLRESGGQLLTIGTITDG